MSTIKLETIQEVLQQEKWQLVSKSYKNLDTDLEYLCSEGHTVFAPWKKMRVSRECPICNQNQYKQIALDQVVPKEKGAFRVLALDQATHNTGYSILDNGKIVHYGLFKAKGNTEVERLVSIKHWLVSMITNWTPDFVGLEGIQYQDVSEGQKMGVTVFQALARLQGVLMETCYSMGIKFDFVHTGTWRNGVGVKGKTRTDKKRSMQLLVKEWFDISVTDDIADAIGIGKYFSKHNSANYEVTNWES